MTGFSLNHMPSDETLELTPSEPAVPDKNPCPFKLQFVDTTDEVGFPFLFFDFVLHQANGSSSGQKRRTLGWAKRRTRSDRKAVLSAGEKQALIENGKIEMEWLEALTKTTASADGVDRADGGANV